MAALFGVEQNEGRAVVLMVTLYFILSAAFVLVQTTAFALFVEEFGSHGLPYAYLSTAALGPLIAYLYLKVSERLSFARALFLNLGFLTVVCLVFWMGLESPVRHWFVFLLPFWFQTLVNLANIVVWHAAGHLFNVRQAKRLFGLIGAGNWLANIVGGFAVAAILTLTGSANAYLLAAFAVIMGALVLRPVLKAMTSPGMPHETRRPATDAKTVVSPLRHPYSRLIFAYTLLWWLAFCFVDNIFYDRADVQLPSGAQLAGFIAQQLSVMGVIAIITSTFLTSLIARRYGLRTGLLVMPVVTTGSILLLAVGGTLGWASSALFWIAAVAKTLNVALGFSLSLAMGSLLFQPLLGNQRGATQTIAEGIVQPVAIGIAGVILLVFNTTLHFNAIGLSYLFLPVAVLWFFVIVRLSRQYPLIMSEALTKRGLGETTTLLLDSSAEAQLRKSLRHPKPGLALYALNQLQQLSPQTWPQTLLDELPDLLAHPAAEVREEALNRVLELRPIAAVPIVRQRLASETSPRAYALLIQVLASMGDQQSSPQVLSALDSPERTVRRGAIIGLISFGGGENSGRAGEALDRLASSADVEDRILAADVLGQCNYAGARPLLTALLEDEVVSVRHAAIRAAGNQAGADYLRSILRACDHAETAHVAEQVLVSKASQTLVVMSAEFGQNSSATIPRERLLSMIRVLGRIPGPASMDLLLTQISVPEAHTRLQALLSLSALGFRARSSSLILEQVNSEIDLASGVAAAIGALDGLEDPTRISILKAALETAFRESRRRILLLLSFILDEQAVLRAYRALDETGTSYSPLALETVDALLPVRLKPVVLPLIEDLSHDRRLELWRDAGVKAPAPALETVLQSLMAPAPENPHAPWTRLCAIYAAVVLRARTCAPTLRDLLADPHPAIREMSRWGLDRLSAAESHQGDTTMLSLVEKVLILKSAPLFGDTPDNVLADIAGRVDEISYEPGQIVFNKGDRGDSLYIIVSGAVQVWDGKRKLNELTEGDVFGELALLDPEPRLASVKAVESTEVLRLDEAHFREVLAARPEVSTAIIRVITRYLRSQLQYAREISARMRASESFGAFGEPVRDSG